MLKNNFGGRKLQMAIQITLAPNLASDDLCCPSLRLLFKVEEQAASVMSALKRYLTKQITTHLLPGSRSSTRLRESGKQEERVFQLHPLPC